MTYAEILKELPSLSPEERAELKEMLQALQQGVSVEELRATNAALDKELQ